MPSSFGTLLHQDSGSTKYLYNPWGDATEGTSQGEIPARGFLFVFLTAGILNETSGHPSEEEGMLL